MGKTNIRICKISFKKTVTWSWTFYVVQESLIYTMVLALFMLHFVLGRGYFWSKLTLFCVIRHSFRFSRLIFYVFGIDVLSSLSSSSLACIYILHFRCHIRETKPQTTKWTKYNAKQGLLAVSYVAKRRNILKNKNV